jgi:hypothetical protein
MVESIERMEDLIMPHDERKGETKEEINCLDKTKYLFTRISLGK